MISTALKIAGLAILLSFLYQLFLIEEPLSMYDSFDLHDESYRYDDIVAPSATGAKLRLLSWTLTKTFLGPILRRRLLLKNQITSVRKLASQVPAHIAPLHHPVHRLNKLERAAHDLRAGSSSQRALHDMKMTGLGAETSRTCHYHNSYLNGSTTPLQVLESTLSAVDRLQPIYRPFAVWPPPPQVFSDMKQSATESAERFKSGSPLSIWDGVPVAFKDCVNITGYVNSDGSRYHAKISRPIEVTAEHEDLLVKRFRDLGAIVLPPTSMVEGGVSPVGYNVHLVGPLNPYDARHYSGGSSGGSAVVVALGIAPVAIGFDGGGSIRTPAAFSGVVGLALGFGRAPQSGSVGKTNVKTGPLAATTEDAALVYATIAPDDARATHYTRLYDGGVNGPPIAHLGAFLTSRLRRGNSGILDGVTLGIFGPWFNNADPVIVRQCRMGVDYLAAHGAEVKDIVIPHIATLRISHALKITTEFALDFDPAYHDLQHDLLEANTRITVGFGSTATALDVLAAEKLRGWAFDYIQQNIFNELQVDAIVTPTTSILPPAIDKRVLECGESNPALQVELLKFVFLANFLGLPSISIPVGLDGNSGMPIGILFTGPQWSEDVLLRLGNVFGPIGRPHDYTDIIRLASNTNLKTIL